MELIVLLVVALLIFGPRRLPAVGRSLGSGMREFKQSLLGEGRGETPETEATAVRAVDHTVEAQPPRKHSVAACSTSIAPPMLDRGDI
jgi:sec-independent protein translocase protein TatA